MKRIPYLLMFIPILTVDLGDWQLYVVHKQVKTEAVCRAKLAEAKGVISKQFPYGTYNFVSEECRRS